MALIRSNQKPAAKYLNKNFQQPMLSLGYDKVIFNCWTTSKLRDLAHPIAVTLAGSLLQNAAALWP